MNCSQIYFKETSIKNAEQIYLNSMGNGGLPDFILRTSKLLKINLPLMDEAILGFLIDSVHYWEENNPVSLNKFDDLSNSAKILIIHGVFKRLEFSLQQSLQNDRCSDTLHDLLQKILIKYVAQYSDKRWNKIVNNNADQIINGN